MIRISLARLALALAVPGAMLVPDSPIHAQQRSGAVDTAIAQALYAASATRAASERRADERSTAQRRQIARLEADFQAARQRAQSNAAQAQAAQAEAERLAATLAEAQRNYVETLAEQDEAYARQIELFRSAVTDVASTPEGLEALRRFNAGDWPGARSILEDLNAAIDRGENIERAARYRSTAEIYYEAYKTGQESEGPVIELYESVVALDPDVAWDWVRLMILYGAVQRFDDMSIAIERAREAEGDPWIASILDSVPTEAIRARDENAAMEGFRQNLATLREGHEQDPDDIETLIGLIGTLYALARIETLNTGLDAAAVYIDELGPLLEANRSIIQSNGQLNFKAVEADYLTLAAQLAGYRQDIETASSQIARAIALRREILTDEPGSIQRQQEFVDTLEVKAAIDWTRSDYRAAILNYREALPMIAAYRVPGRNPIGQLIGLAERLIRVASQADDLDMIEDATALARESLAVSRQIYQRDPANPGGHVRLAEALLGGGELAFRANGQSGTVPLLEEARTFADGLVAQYPASLETRRIGWLVYGSLADMSYSNVGWSDVVERIEADRQAGLIDQGAENLLSVARENLAGPEG